MTEDVADLPAAETSTSKPKRLWPWLVGILMMYLIICFTLITIDGLGLMSREFGQATHPFVRPVISIILAYPALNDALDTYLRWLISFR